MAWTEQQDAQLRTLATEMNLGAVADVMGMTRGKVWSRATRKKIKGLSLRETKQPTEGEYIGICRDIAKETGVKSSALLGRSSKAMIAHARWKVWRRILGVYPQYSVAGIARVVGYNHTAILYGMRRLADLEDQMQNSDSGRNAKNANANGGYSNPVWVVHGTIMDAPIIRRVRAKNKDEAMKRAHDYSIIVVTCEIAKLCSTNTTR